MYTEWVCCWLQKYIGLIRKNREKYLRHNIVQIKSKLNDSVAMLSLNFRLLFEVMKSLVICVKRIRSILLNFPLAIRISRLLGSAPNFMVLEKSLFYQHILNCRLGIEMWHTIYVEINEIKWGRFRITHWLPFILNKLHYKASTAVAD